MQKKCLRPKTVKVSNSRSQMERNLEVRESPQRQDQLTSQDLREELQGNPERSQPRETQDDVEASNDFDQSKVTSFIVITLNPRVHLYVPKEESPIPLKYFYLTRTTFTSLEGLQAKGYQQLLQRPMWIETLSESWTGFTKFTLLNENLLQHICGLGGALQ